MNRPSQARQRWRRERAGDRLKKKERCITSVYGLYIQPSCNTSRDNGHIQRRCQNIDVYNGTYNGTSTCGSYRLIMSSPSQLCGWGVGGAHTYENGPRGHHPCACHRLGGTHPQRGHNEAFVAPQGWPSSLRALVAEALVCVRTITRQRRPHTPKRLTQLEREASGCWRGCQ